MFNLESALNPLLQQNIVFSINEKILKKGRFLLYSVDDYYINFLLKTEKSNSKSYELPMPFDIHQFALTAIQFDYTLQALAGKSDSLFIKLNMITRKKQTKLFNSKLSIVLDI